MQDSWVDLVTKLLKGCRARKVVRISREII